MIDLLAIVGFCTVVVFIWCVAESCIGAHSDLQSLKLRVAALENKKVRK